MNAETISLYLPCLTNVNMTGISWLANHSKYVNSKLFQEILQTSLISVVIHTEYFRGIA